MTPLNPLLKQAITSTLRHALTVGAGALITAGALQPGQADAFGDIATGILVFTATLLWSFLEKKLAAKSKS